MSYEAPGDGIRLGVASHQGRVVSRESSGISRLELARDYRILPYDVWRRLAREAMEIRKMLTALRRAVLRSIEQVDMPDASPPSAEPTKSEETEPDA